MSYFYLTIAFTLNSIANILLKVKSSEGFRFAEFGWKEIFIGNYLFFLGLFLFGVNVVFYFLALRSMPLSTAYPIMTAMSFLIINSYAFFCLNEKINSTQVLGYLLVVAGIVVIFYFSKKV